MAYGADNSTLCRFTGSMHGIRQKIVTDNLLGDVAEAQELSVDDLVRRSLESSFEAEDEPGNSRSGESWEAIFALAKRSEDEVFESARRLLFFGDPWVRARGANILGQFRPDSKANARFLALSTALEAESDDRVITSLIYATSHLHDERMLPRYLVYVSHRDPNVRQAVAMSIEPGWGEVAVKALCALCTDEWAGARDWATFKFRISKIDSPEIRHCLRARLDDKEPQVRAEAICALAHRHDLACLKQLVNDLNDLDAFDDYFCHIDAAHALIGCDPDDERSAADLRNELLKLYPHS